MKILLIISVIVLTCAKPPPILPSDNIQLLKYENDNSGGDGYKYSYVQSDGTRQEQRGEIKNKGSQDESIAVQGSFSWIGPDGVNYTVNYVADEEGYQPDVGEGPGCPLSPGALASCVG